MNETANNQEQTIYDEAREIIYGDRQKSYGPPENSLNRIAELWDTYLQNKVRNVVRQAVHYFAVGRQVTDDELRGFTEKFLGASMGIDYRDVCHLMQLLKWARDETNPKHDNVKDDVGYAGLVARVRERKPVFSQIPSPFFRPVVEPVAPIKAEDIEIMTAKKRKPQPRTKAGKFKKAKKAKK